MMIILFVGQIYQGLQALLLQNFKLFTRLALKLPGKYLKLPSSVKTIVSSPFPKSNMLSPCDVEGDRSHPDVLEHGDRLRNMVVTLTLVLEGRL